MMLLNLGGAALAAGDLNESKRRQVEALRIAYKIDDRIGQFYLLAALAYHTHDRRPAAGRGAAARGVASH